MDVTFSFSLKIRKSTNMTLRCNDAGQFDVRVWDA